MAANALSLVETSKLENYEVVIEDGLKNFVDVGRALMAIRDERLYRVGHSTFEDYCRERWGMVKRHANRIIAASQVVKAVGPTGPKPESERHVRPLTALPESEQPVVWQEAVNTAPAGKVTARHVEKIVAEHKEKQRPKSSTNGSTKTKRDPRRWAPWEAALTRLKEVTDQMHKEFPHENFRRQVQQKLTEALDLSKEWRRAVREPL